MSNTIYIEVSVSERLPDKTGRYIAFNVDESPFMHILRFFAESKTWCYEDIPTPHCVKVTHWLEKVEKSMSDYDAAVKYLNGCERISSPGRCFLFQDATHAIKIAAGLEV